MLPIDIRQPICDFLLMVNSNRGRIIGPGVHFLSPGLL